MFTFVPWALLPVGKVSKLQVHWRQEPPGAVDSYVSEMLSHLPSPTLPVAAKPGVISCPKRGKCSGKLYCVTYELILFPDALIRLEIVISAS